MSDKPKVQVLMCDGAMLVGGKWTLQGVFDRINFHSALPATKSPFFIFFRITDIFIKQGSSLLLEIRKNFLEEAGEDNLPIFRGTLDFEIDKQGQQTLARRTNFEFAMPIGPTRYEKPGVYDIAFFVDNEFVDVWTFRVNEPAT